MRLVELPIESIAVEEALRSLDGVEEAPLKDLVESIRSVGLLHPLVVRPEGDRYRLVAGYRRLLALSRLGWKTVPAVLVEYADGEALKAELGENAARQPLPPHREAEAILSLLSYRLGVSPEEARSLCYAAYNAKRRGKPLPPEFGTIEAELASVGRSFDYFVASILPALKWPKAVKEALEKGEISSREARALSRLGEAAGEAVERLKEGEKVKDVIREVGKASREIKGAVAIQTFHDELGEVSVLPNGVLAPHRPTTTAPALAQGGTLLQMAEEVALRLKLTGKEVTLFYPEPDFVRGFLNAGVAVRWVDATKHAHYVFTPDEVPLTRANLEGAVLFLRPGEGRAAAQGEPDAQDPTASWKLLDWVAMATYPLVVVSRLEYVYRLGRPVMGVSLDGEWPKVSVWAMLGRAGAQ